jgi:hypothetical protein
MHMPRTFYEEFQARWPVLFKAVEKRFAKLMPPAEFVEAQALLARFSTDEEIVELLVDIQRRLLGRKPTKENEEYSMFLSMLETAGLLGAFILYGKRSFFIRPNLVQRLAHTRLDIVPADIKLPFPFFMLVFDDPISREAAKEVWPTDGPISAFVNIGPSVEGTFKGETSIMIHVEVRLAGGRINFDPLLPHEPMAWIALNALDYIDEPWDQNRPVAVKKPSGTLSKKSSHLSYIDVGRRYQPMDAPPLGLPSLRWPSPLRVWCLAV